MTTDNVKLFNERLAYWTRQGLIGADAYLRLATDHELPAFFTQRDLAGITGLGELAIKQRRMRQAEPAWVALSDRAVRYGRVEVCRWLAGGVRTPKTKEAVA